MNSMTRKLFLALVLLCCIALGTVTAYSDGFFIGGVSFSAGSLIAQGDFVRYGNEDLLVTLIGSGTVKAMCENGGGNQSPGRNSITVSVSQTGLFSTDTNGKAAVTVTSPDPSMASFEPSPSPKDAGCPNGKSWHVVGIIDRSTNWTAATLTVQSRTTGEYLFNQSYTCLTTFDSNGINTGVTCSPVN